MYLNPQVVAINDVDDYPAGERTYQMAEIARRRKLFRAARPVAPITGRSVIVTDDGIATGATMIAALRVVRAHQPHELIVAVPVASPDRLREVGKFGDRATPADHSAALLKLDSATTNGCSPRTSWIAMRSTCASANSLDFPPEADMPDHPAEPMAQLSCPSVLERALREMLRTFARAGLHAAVAASLVSISLLYAHASQPSPAASTAKVAKDAPKPAAPNDRRAASPPKEVGQPAAPVTFATHIAPFFAKYCTSCHGGDKPKAKLALDTYKDETAVGDAMKDGRVWEAMIQSLRNQEMPPAKSNKPRPTATEAELIASWVDSKLNAVLEGSGPGPAVLRRLTNVEYNNTIRDIFGVTLRVGVSQPAEGFPADQVQFGFDNVALSQSLSVSHLEKYRAAASNVLEWVFADAKARQRILFCEPAKPGEEQQCAAKIIGQFGRRVFRRPLTAAESERFLRLVEDVLKNKEPFAKSIQVALQSMLISPHFLFRMEEAVHPDSEYALAARLSYLLWRSTPDDALLDAAEQGKLRQQLDEQVTRLLKDPRSGAFAGGIERGLDGFFPQWLGLRNFKAETPDKVLFRGFGYPLYLAMLKETDMYCSTIVREDRSVLEFLDSDYTFLNEGLAKFYGIAGVKGDQFRRVILAGSARGGIITHGSILTLTSSPDRTSPVKRGAWILETLLGTPPPPPPPDVVQVTFNTKPDAAASLREQLKRHRVDPNCAACHERIDPLGFALENFNAVGAWREFEGKFKIDAKTSLPTGREIDGAAGLRAELKTRSSDFCRCLAEKLFIYALGRGSLPADRPHIHRVADALAANEYRFSILLREVIRSDLFQMPPRKGTPR
jgi:Protein of unknown function (DUF1592)/Protein of unknown function (DUF1588)/Protein of unknown function (DUF1585)/Protein of unknown function (DUF1595)/Protein of unknown function (DUF1587)/Phosphoribosyl transferase domain/Planctomycete cytochrome C